VIEIDFSIFLSHTISSGNSGKSYRRSKLCIFKLAKVYDARESVQMVTGNEGSDISLNNMSVHPKIHPNASKKFRGVY
jgi:hypothetical protein